MLNENHELYKLSESIDWIFIEDAITGLIIQPYQGQWRLVAGSIYLKSFYDLSTAEVIERWCACPYCRFFCSGEVMTENADAFPVLPEVLEKLSLALAGEGYDTMIQALLVPTGPQKITPPHSSLAVH